MFFVYQASNAEDPATTTTTTAPEDELIRLYVKPKRKYRRKKNRNKVLNSADDEIPGKLLFYEYFSVCIHQF
jgi:hypothetical protein